ncbi:MAG: putative quinol monooxygenase [Myxococcota bacterium]|nr:putative quinol monooxygenase [Myxococcota bacterium]
MLVIAGHIRLDPAKRDEAIAAAREMMTDTHQEAGCISYTFSADLSDEGVFHIFEEWESQEALDAHFKAPHMARFQGLMPNFGLKEMKVQRYEVSSAGPLG